MATLAKLAVLFLLVFVCTQAQKMTRQCTCQEFQKCKQQILVNIFPCADKCQVCAAKIDIYSLVKEVTTKKITYL